MCRTILLVVVCAIVTSQAAANPSNLTGAFSFGATSEKGKEALIAADLTYRVPLDRWTLPFGVEIGLYGIASTMDFESGSHPHETYLALVWGSGLRLGVVRPAYDSVLPSVFAGYAPLEEEQRLEFSRSFTTTQAMRETAIPLSASWSRDTGALSWAVSVHSAPNKDFSSASAAMSWKQGSWTFAGALEGVWRDGNDGAETMAKLGLRWNGLWGDAGLTYLMPDANGVPNAIALDVTAQVTARMRLSAFGEFSEDSGSDVWGIGAGYAVGKSSEVTSAVTRHGDDTRMHLTLTRLF